MKKCLLIIVLSLAIFSIKAQNSSGGLSRFSEMLNFNAGVTLSRFTGYNQLNSSFLYGFAFGTGVKIPVLLHTYIIPGAGFAMAGSKYTGYDQYSLGYADVSVDGEYDIDNPDLYLQTGVRARFLTSAKYKYQGTITDIKSRFKNTDAGLDIGAGYRITPKLHIFFLAIIGLTNIVATTGDAYNRDFEAGVRANF